MKTYIFLLITVTVINITHCKHNYVLKQVFIFSRHNLRTPVGKHMDVLTRKPWPRYRERHGDLTRKGALLEGYMGRYFSSWLAGKGFLSGRCPSTSDVYVRANNMARTMATAQSFGDRAFPSCRVRVHHSNKHTRDPLFNNYIHNNSLAFRQAVARKTQDRIHSLNFTKTYEVLEDVLDYRKSSKCRHERLCRLSMEKTEVSNLRGGGIPAVVGALNTGHSIVDFFLMEYYEGFKRKDVAWGSISVQDIAPLMKLYRAYNDVIYDVYQLVKDTARPLITYMKQALSEKSARLCILFGHDTNIHSIMTYLRFKSYKLAGQLERTPIGGKLVFQRWHDKVNDRYLLKVEYVFQSSDQIRYAKKLSARNPPIISVMELENCEIDKHGFCSWDDFMGILHEA